MLNNPNSQDTFLGSTILSGLVVTAVIAFFFLSVSWGNPKIGHHSSTVGSATKTNHLR